MSDVIRSKPRRQNGRAPFRFPDKLENAISASPFFLSQPQDKLASGGCGGWRTDSVVAPLPLPRQAGKRHIRGMRGVARAVPLFPPFRCLYFQTTMHLHNCQAHEYQFFIKILQKKGRRFKAVLFFYALVRVTTLPSDKRVTVTVSASTISNRSSGWARASSAPTAYTPSRRKNRPVAASASRSVCI